jgi:nucleotide-binding universal stress UspA family protein
MKILIAYDGSKCSDAALDDLERAGLPAKGDALVVSVAEVWLPPPNIEAESGRDETDEFIEDIVEAHRRKGELMVAEAETKVQVGRERILKALPQWNVTTHATYGSPAWAILSAAGEFKADLIIVGSQGHSALSRFILGSVSQKVLTEAACSVRISRGRIEVDPSPLRIVIGFDASAGAMAAVDSVAERQWPAGTEIRLVAATDTLNVPASEAESGNVLHLENDWIATYTDKAAELLRKAGLKVETSMRSGNPNNVLVEEAESWPADCIFVGANAEGSRLERFLLGTTSAAVAARAHCSVEVVRRSK